MIFGVQMLKKPKGMNRALVGFGAADEVILFKSWLNTVYIIEGCFDHMSDY